MLDIIQECIVAANFLFTVCLAYLRYFDDKNKKQIILAENQQEQINNIKLDVAVLKERLSNEKNEWETIVDKLDEIKGRLL